MHKSLLSVLADPISKTKLEIKNNSSSSGELVIEGTLISPETGRSYVITKGIPRFVVTEDQDQKQTASSFGFKWQQRDTYDSPQVHDTAQKWLLKRYGFSTSSEMRDFFWSRRRILDAGCGSGYTASLWMDSRPPNTEWFGIDISAAIDVAQERLGIVKNAHYIQADILQLPFGDDTFDTVFSEGVLHHTPSTELALKSLATVLVPGGEALFYVYRKKGPIREFTDDHVREAVAGLDPKEAWALLRPLTSLGQKLAELHCQVEVPDDIPYLGIKAGRYDIQRLIYWHFAKMFWNENLSFEENNHVNFDWYHPRYAHRQTEEEVRRWCAQAHLSITHFNVEESGFTVRAIKR